MSRTNLKKLDSGAPTFEENNEVVILTDTSTKRLDRPRGTSLKLFAEEKIVIKAVRYQKSLPQKERPISPSVVSLSGAQRRVRATITKTKEVMRRVQKVIRRK